MSDIFVSYKAEDRRRVDPLVQALESEGLSVWWDAHVGGGEAWREAIAEHLDAAKCVMVVWSRRSTGSEGRFVRDEASRAQRLGTYLAVTIDKVEPPLGFGEMQALSLTGWRGDPSDAHYRAVSTCVHSMLGRTARANPARTGSVHVSRRTALAAGGGGIVLAAGAGAWLLLRPAGAKANTIAVLPFANLSGDPAQNYFSDGMAEEVRGALAALGGLEVVARTSSEMLRNVDAVTAARRLRVANVIAGSVRRSPSTVRVSAQLVDGKSGLDRWSQTFDRPLGDVLQIQSDIAASVARALSVELGSSARALLTLGGTKYPQAQDFLLQAIATDGDDSEKAMLRRVALLEQATQLDPDYAEAWARKGLQQELWASTIARNSQEKDRGEADALQSVRRAIAIAPTMAIGPSFLGIIYNNQLAMKRSLDELQRAESLPGADAAVFLNYALGLCKARRQAEAESTIGRTTSLDPLNPIARMAQSLILFWGRRYSEAIEASRRTLAIAPENIRAKAVLGWSLLLLGRTDDAQRQFKKMPADDYRRLVGEGAIAARSGRKVDALGAIQAIEKRYGDAANYQYAEIYAQLGLADEALKALDEAWQKRDSGMGGIQVDPFIDPVRNDDRFPAIVRRLFG